MNAFLPALAALLAANPAAPQAPSQAYKTGNDLLTDCDGPAADEGDKSLCLGYILGVVDGAEGLGIALDLGKLNVPPAVTAGQLRDIVVRYLTAHPELRHYSAAQLVYIAALEAFPKR